MMALLAKAIRNLPKIMLAKAISSYPQNHSQLADLLSVTRRGDDVFDTPYTFAWPSMCGCCTETKHDRLIAVLLVLRCMTPANYLLQPAIPFTRLPPRGDYYFI
jgi:hypothetical protein